MKHTIEIKQGIEVKVGNTTYRINSVADRLIGIDIIQFGSTSEVASVQRRAGQETMPIATMRRRVAASLAYTDGM